ncbi:daptide biosynthesis intramembrane metalloprotease [Amycolatopsis azurea]|uniref:daptide biosynthesis intramembrane metalloprotease n=1 Tax=Amycolatopsis azurea TaxID=36819 RepID=UPI00382013B0
MTIDDLTRPRLAPWITVHRPMADGAPWIVERPGENPLRVSADVGTLLSAFDGERDAAGLAAALGERWTPELVHTAVDKVSKLGLLVSDDTPAPVPERRFVARSWTALQLRVIQASQVLDPVRPLLTRLSGRVVLGTSLAAILLGVLTLAVQHETVAAALGRPLPLSSALTIWLGLGVVTLIHELGHGATLTHFHGRPGWLGVMLFYLTPACFCEVSDGWRLAKPRQRVMVALAGVITHATVASVVALAGLLLPGGDLRTTVIAFSIATYLTAAINLAPWIKLDGYLALMSYLDIPQLRDKAMADARGWLGHVALGIRRPAPALARPQLAVPFGLLCIVFPVAVLCFAVTRWGHQLANLGATGAALKLLLIALLVGWFCRKVFVMLRTALRSGVGVLRRTVVIAVVLASLAVLLGGIRVHDDRQGGYVKDRVGVLLALPPGSDPESVRAGDSVVLERKGLFLTTVIGSARVSGDRPENARVPAEALISFRSDSSVDAVVVRLDTVQAPQLDDVGAATVPGGTRPLGLWLFQEHVTSAWRTIFGK